ncbi:MAG: glycosyl hydrolase family 18 protein [Gammaproteobacteria bacterium]
MNRILRIALTILVLFSFHASCFALENMFYILRTNPTPHRFSNLNNHAKFINVLISQAYIIDEQGNVKGFIDPEVLKFANEHAIKVMVMVTNVEFDKPKTHRFLSKISAQRKAIQTIIDLSKQYHYYGVQFDFENIGLEDKASLTRFYLAAAEALHKNGFKISFAVIPVTADAPQESDFLKQKYENWGGAYDLKALGESGDFITVMAYDQHTRGTTPGPVASIPWVEAVIKHTLQFIAPQKISLGIPVYSGYWFTGDHSVNGVEQISVHLFDLSYEKVQALMSKYHIKLKWNDIDKVNYAIYEQAWLNQYLFVEDAQSFKAKLALAKKYHLGSISVFRLGIEDPRIWSLLESKNIF